MNQKEYEELCEAVEQYVSGSSKELEKQINEIKAKMKSHYRFLVFEIILLFALHILNFVEIVRLRG